MSRCEIVSAPSRARCSAGVTTAEGCADEVDGLRHMCTLSLFMVIYPPSLAALAGSED